MPSTYRQGPAPTRVDHPSIWGPMLTEPYRSRASHFFFLVDQTPPDLLPWLLSGDLSNATDAQRVQIRDQLLRIFNEHVTPELKASTEEMASNMRKYGLLVRKGDPRFVTPNNIGEYHCQIDTVAWRLSRVCRMLHCMDLAAEAGAWQVCWKEALHGKVPDDKPIYALSGSALAARNLPGDEEIALRILRIACDKERDFTEDPAANPFTPLLSHSSLYRILRRRGEDKEAEKMEDALVDYAKSILSGVAQSRGKEVLGNLLAKGEKTNRVVERLGGPEAVANGGVFSTKQAQMARERCGYCMKPSLPLQPFKTCSRCKQVVYVRPLLDLCALQSLTLVECSADCQAKGWKGDATRPAHKKHCVSAEDRANYLSHLPEEDRQVQHMVDAFRKFATKVGACIAGTNAYSALDMQKDMLRCYTHAILIHCVPTNAERTKFKISKVEAQKVTKAMTDKYFGDADFFIHNNPWAAGILNADRSRPGVPELLEAQRQYQLRNGTFSGMRDNNLWLTTAMISLEAKINGKLGCTAFTEVIDIAPINCTHDPDYEANIKALRPSKMVLTRDETLKKSNPEGFAIPEADEVERWQRGRGVVRSGVSLGE